MDSIISPIVESLVSPVVESVKKHLGFLVYSTEYVEDMKKKMDNLNHIEKDIQESGSESHRKRKWLEDVKNLNERSNLIEAPRFFNLPKRYKLGKQSYGILEEIEDLENRESKIVFTHAQKCLAEIASTSTGPSTSTPNGTQNNFKSRQLIYNAALKFLQPNNESHRMIALCGMGGVGKTTMMEQLMKEMQASNVFDRVVKVVIGESTSLISLQRAIAIYINKEDLKEETQDARADRLRTIFEGMANQGNKTLVIMDDIWSEVDLKDVGLSPLPNGFKLLITSRFDYVCTKMGVKIDAVNTIPFLDEAEAKDLFFGIVGPSTLDGDDPELYKIGEAIVNKCGGLPIALKTIANNLNGNIKEAWKTALRRLKNNNLKDLKSITYQIFEISYEHIKDVDERAIFLLSALFPDDFDIRKEDLLMFGRGLGFLKDGNTLGEARSDMEECVNNLLRANLLTKSDLMGCVKMHDLVRAFVLKEILEGKQASIVNTDDKIEQNANESYERILLKCTGMTKFPTGFNFPNLSLLMLMDWNKLFKFPEDIFESMKKLEVVSYVNMHIPLLPQRPEHFTKLRTLCLRSCWLIDDISFLGSLSNLEALSIVDCYIRRLPSMIGMLKKLKLLDLTGCVDLRIDDGVLQNLKSLEELYMRANEYSCIMFTDANCDELEILSQQLFALELEFFENKAQPKKVSFEKLERFRISIGCRLANLTGDKKYSFKNTIKFVGECNELLECRISELFEKTEELNLQVNDMNHLEKIVSTHHSFSNLKVLYVSDCKELTYLFTVAMVSSLKNLERLEVSYCRVMRTLVDEDCTVGVIRFPKLNFMYLEKLQNMASLCRTVIEFPELVELKLRYLPNFTSISPDSSNPGGIQSLLNKEVVIPKLEKLELEDMENLKQMWPCQIPTVEKNNVSMLRKIAVWRCHSLTNIFPDNPLPMLNNLEELTVKWCGSIEVIFNIDFENVSEMEGHVSRLRSIKVESLSNLRELWRMRGVNNSNILINGFQGVQSIEICYCARFTNIFTPVTTNFDLRALINYETKEWNVKSEVDDYTCHHLKHLKLSSDERVEVVFDMDRQLATIQPQQLLPYLYLDSIDLFNLKEMSHVWKCCNWNKVFVPQHQVLQFPFQNLTDIQLWYCEKIKYLFSPLVAKYLSSLKSVQIRDCHGIEEVISRRDDEHELNTTSTSAYQDTTLFPHLDTLQIKQLPNLKSVDDGDTRCRSDQLSSNITNTTHDEFQSGQVIGASWSLCQYPRTISIYECNALSSLIPWYAVGQMKRLEELNIRVCSEMTEVFECESINTVDEGGAPLRNVTVVVVSNLKSLFISECDRLPHIFTFSTLGTLHHLKELRVNRCNAMQVIVKQENGTSSDCVALPRLETLELDDLPNLKAFFLGMNDFRWPSLDKILIKDCPELMMVTSGQSTTPKLKYIQTRFGKYSSECGLNFHGTISQTTLPPSSDPTISKGMPCSFHNLIEINIECKDAVTTIIPSHALLQLQKLQQIHLSDCNRVEEVFEVVALEGTNGRGLNASQTVVPIPNLTQVKLRWVKDLKYLWKSNKWMVLEFPNLTTLFIHACENLEHVFTCSMVGSLVQLQNLYISYCKNIEVIVKQEEEEEECEGKMNDIMLPHLNSIRIKYLPKLKGFCLGKEAFSLPLLETLEIESCSALTVFTNGHVSTPELKVINTNFKFYYVNTDINSFIKTKHEEKLQDYDEDEDGDGEDEDGKDRDGGGEDVVCEDRQHATLNNEDQTRGGE